MHAFIFTACCFDFEYKKGTTHKLTLFYALKRINFLAVSVLNLRQFLSPTYFATFECSYYRSDNEYRLLISIILQCHTWHA